MPRDPLEMKVKKLQFRRKQALTVKFAKLELKISATYSKGAVEATTSSSGYEVTFINWWLSG